VTDAAKVPASRGHRDLPVFLIVMALLVGVAFIAPSVLAAQHPYLRASVLVGYAAALTGLLMAMSGLAATWRKNAPPGSHFFPALSRLLARIGGMEKTPATADDRSEEPAGRLSVEGIPLAVKGLGLTALGLLLQAFGQGLPS
jgi:hypothetical protein